MSIVEKCFSSINKAKKLKNLNIFITECFEAATSEAKASESRIKNNGLKSKLDGSLFTIKDNFSTKSIRTTCGSKMLENYIPPYNATVVDRLLNAGGILLGKTNMDEFGMGSVSSSYFGTVKHPANAKRKDLDDSSNDFFITGGSSGGSAASVSSGLVDFSIGSDTGGSIRNPASICGCLGYKPTYGLVSRFGLIPLNNYFDTVGVMAQNMQILVDVLNTISGPDANDSTNIKSQFTPIKLDAKYAPKKLKIGVPQEFFPNGLSENNHRAWKSTIDVFLKAEPSVQIVPISLPNSTYSMSCYSVLTSCEVASNFGRYDGIRYGYDSRTNKDSNRRMGFEETLTKNRDESLGKIVKGRIVSGNYFLLKDNYEKYFQKSHQIRQMIANEFRQAFESIDLLITPTCFHDTPTYSEYLKQEQVFDERDFFTACANLAGVPAISIPSLLSNDTNRLPIGIQFIAPWKRDDFLCNVSQWFIQNNSSNYPYQYNFVF